jgi:hypothetical protein
MAGQQNLLNLTQENYYDNFETAILKQADLHYLVKKFGIGEDIDRDRLRHDQMFYNILCTDECELIDWVNKKITGQINKCDTSIKVKNIFGEFPNISNISDSADEQCEWSTIEW